MKNAVVLMNLGGPDSLDAVEPFLFNLFYDPAIVRVPNPFRYLIAKLISKRRAPIAQDIYKKIGGRSPIFPNTQAQAVILENALGSQYKVFIAMRYWHPLTQDTFHQVEEYQPDNVILLPLYPQFSTTTTASSIKEWHKVATNPSWRTYEVCCYPTVQPYIQSQSEVLLRTYIKVMEETQKKPRILFSAHGLPERIVKSGDPYPIQVRETCLSVIKYLATHAGTTFDWILCYQSRVGPLKWIGPSTDHVIAEHGRSSSETPLVIVPITFVSEHSETLVELDIEYKHLAQESGVKHYYRVPTVSTDPLFIDCLAAEVKKVLSAQNDCFCAKFKGTEKGCHKSQKCFSLSS